MDQQAEKEGLKILENIEEELEQIKERTPTSRHAFLHGIWQGAGVIVGSIVALVAIGWGLSLLGIIPGLNVLTQYFQDAIQHLPNRTP